jgi:hypothetical protein
VVRCLAELDGDLYVLTSLGCHENFSPTGRRSNQVLALSLSPLEARRADSRVALLIGNAAYQNTPALANPGNDAEDTAAALRRAGFNVHFEKDLTKRGMERALAA